MFKSAAIVFAISACVIAIAFASFSLNFDNITIYPIDADDTQYHQPTPETEVPALESIS